MGCQAKCQRTADEPNLAKSHHSKQLRECRATCCFARRRVRRALSAFIIEGLTRTPVRRIGSRAISSSGAHWRSIHIMTSLRHPSAAPGSASASFALDGRLAVVTGGYGVLGGTIASGLAAAGARVIILGRRRAVADSKAEEIREAGGLADVSVADVLDDASLRSAAEDLRARGLGEIDILFNAAGGNVARARNDNRSRSSTFRSTRSTKCCVSTFTGPSIPSMIFGEIDGRARIAARSSTSRRWRRRRR